MDDNNPCHPCSLGSGDPCRNDGIFLRSAVLRGGGSTLQQGLTMIELLISIVMGIFLLTGLALIFLSNKISFATQNGLAQLQNNQLLAISILTNVVQSAGYYPNPSTNSTASILPASNGSVTIKNGASSSILTVSYPQQGAVSGGSINGSDSISVRAIGAMNCIGNTSTTDLISSTLTVDSNNNLQCTTWDITSSTNACPNCSTATQTLVTGVSSMTVLYGVSPASDSATQYMTTANVTANNMWGRIMSVRVTLNFVNPLYSLKNTAGQPATLQFIKVIGLMEHL